MIIPSLPHSVPPPPLLGVSRVCPGPWRLRWLHDLNPSWNITRYDVIWEEGGEEVGTAEVTVLPPPQEVYEVALSGLNVTSEYSIRVRGVNRDGPGNYSDDLVYQPHLCGEYSGPFRSSPFLLAFFTSHSSCAPQITCCFVGCTLLSIKEHKMNWHSIRINMCIMCSFIFVPGSGL